MNRNKLKKNKIPFKTKLKVGDPIIVKTGKDKGKRGILEKIFFKKRRFLVPSLNMAKKHQKKRTNEEPGKIIEISLPMEPSNVMIYCETCKKGTRIQMLLKDNTKIRICSTCKKSLKNNKSTSTKTKT